MGLFDFFKRRRERESAVHLPSSAGADAAAAQPVVGEQIAGGGEFDLSSLNLEAPNMMESLQMLTQLGPMIQKAITEGNVTIEQGASQTIDMRGSPLGEQIREILKQHGIDPDAGTAGQQVDASDYGDMQQQILAALVKHGVDTGASGSSVNLEVKKED